ncbi:hypothetical protein CPLU01_13887 [Colletotrichum plurivorum]|uniref:Uncharacterized protein n=1 Tax=Colletotrichum plurivorum TaxID=2175906 RepID=A0A8H6JPH1_9PEZI|nr:hypothetical protein CPLU01_13887 [Colletotrichum plurivorum]
MSKLHETIEFTGRERNGEFPRVDVCADGSFCCRHGNNPCCSESNVQKFNLDNEGRLLSSSTLASSTATASQVTATSSSGSGSGQDNGEALGLKIGLRVGIPLVAIVAVLGTWCFFRKRRNRQTNNTAQGTDNTAALSRDTPHFKAMPSFMEVSITYEKGGPIFLAELHLFKGILQKICHSL